MTDAITNKNDKANFHIFLGLFLMKEPWQPSNISFLEVESTHKNNNHKALA